MADDRKKADRANPLQNSIHHDAEAEEGGSINFGNLELPVEKRKIAVNNVAGELYLSDEEYFQFHDLMQAIYNEISKDFSRMTLQFREDVKNKTHRYSEAETELIRKTEKKIKEAAKMAGYEKHELENYFESTGRVPNVEEYQEIIKLLQTTPPLSEIKQAREADYEDYKNFARHLLKISHEESSDDANYKQEFTPNHRKPSPLSSPKGRGGTIHSTSNRADFSLPPLPLGEERGEGITLKSYSVQTLESEDLQKEGEGAGGDIYKEFPYLAPSLNDDQMKLSIGKKQAELRFENANMIEQDLEEEEEKNKAFQKELIEINDLMLELMKVGATPDQINELRERKKKLEEVAIGAQSKAVKKIKDAIAMQMGEASKLVTNTLRNLKGAEKKAFQTFLKEGGMKQISEAPSIGAVKNILAGFVKQVQGKTLSVKIKDMKMDQHYDKQKKNAEIKVYKQNNKLSPLDKYKYDALRKELSKEQKKETEDKSNEKDKKPREKEKREEVKIDIPPPSIGR